MEGAVKRIQRAWRKSAAQRGYTANMSVSGAVARSARPTTAASATSATQPQAGQDGASQIESSFLSSGPSVMSSYSYTYSYYTGTASDGTPFNGTSDSSFVGTPLSLSGYMSDGEPVAASQQHQQHLQADLQGQATYGSSINSTPHSLAAGMPYSPTAVPAAAAVLGGADAASCDTTDTAVPFSSGPLDGPGASWSPGSYAGGLASNTTATRVGGLVDPVARSSSVDLLTGLAQHKAAAGVPDGNSVWPTPRLAG